MTQASESFQDEVKHWTRACFGEEISCDLLERSFRFTEEALELVQAVGECSREEAHALVDYVWDRPIGMVSQVVGGTLVTLAALCNALGIDMMAAAESEIARCWVNIERIRAKQAAKVFRSPLPGEEEP